MFDYTGTYTDLYQLRMAQVYFLKKQTNHNAVFDYFFRKLPFGGGYAIFSGLEDFLETLVHLRFDQKDLTYLKTQGFHPDFLNYLQDFHFHGSVYAYQEGELAFPGCPIITIEAPIIEAQIIETILLNIINFQTLIATKASRVRQVSGDKRLIDFGLRRAQGTGGYSASRAAIVGGFDATSNVRAGRDYNIPISGTMAHSFIQSYDNELAAFRDFAEINPDNSVMLVDTYNTLKSGVPHAIQVGKEMEARGQKLKGIRLDSGDLVLLAKQARQMLDAAGLNYVKIIASNQLDEYVIQSLLKQGAPIDAFGVGTSLVTGYPDGALDGVYKLALSDNKPSIKLSESLKKVTLPYKKQVYRVTQQDGTYWGADVIALVDESPDGLVQMHDPFGTSKPISLGHHHLEPLLQQVMKHGKRVQPAKTLQDIAQQVQKNLTQLPKEYKVFDKPEIYKVGLSDQLKIERDHLIEEHTKHSLIPPEEGINTE